MKYVTLGVAAALAIGMSFSAQAQQHAIYTGSQKGAYNSTFCPPLPEVLGKAQFRGYRCTPSAGTTENIKKVLANPTDIGFVQLDVYAKEAATNPEINKKLIVVRNLACEGLWIVTKNDRIKDYSDIFALARRLPFRLPGEQSGPAATFAYLQSLDPKGIGLIQKSNIQYDRDVGAMLERVAHSTSGDVGMFVQFADPENGNIKKMLELGLTPIGVISRDVLNAKVDSKEVYQLQEFQLANGWFTGKAVTTTCTPTAIITGNPAAMTNENDKANQTDMVTELRNVPEDALLPHDSRLVKLMKSIKSISGKALEETLAAADVAKKKALELAQ
jgi:hypothetical protein